MKHLTGRTWGAALLPIIAVAALAGPQAAEDFQSVWRDREFTLDGSAAEWEGSLRRVEKSEVYVGVLNDDYYLYLCLQSRDPRISREAMFRGLIVDLDPGKGGPFSIQYPIGVHGSDEAPPGRGPGGGEKMWEAAQETLDTFLLLEPGGKERLRFAADNGFGIGLRVSAAGGEFVYEMKIPLNAGPLHPHAVGARPGATLTLAIRTPEMDREGMGGRPEGGIRIGPGGGEGAGGGPGVMRGGEGRGPAPGRGPDSPKPLNLKVRFRLALSGLKDHSSGVVSP